MTSAALGISTQIKIVKLAQLKWEGICKGGEGQTLRKTNLIKF